VSIIGTFAMLHVFGFAITRWPVGWCWRRHVVDNAMSWVERSGALRRGISPREATYAAMRRRVRASIAIAL